MILASDIGGTTTRLALLEMEGKWPRVVVGQTFASHEHKSLDEIVQKFLGEYGGTMKSACFGVAGRVRNRLFTFALLFRSLGDRVHSMCGRSDAFVG